MGKLTPEEETRNKILMRERDRERKRMKRMNPEYRKMEQERDRDRKKARRANEAFRQLEKLRDKLRKERKKGIISETTMPTEFVSLPSVPVEPEVIISDPLHHGAGTGGSHQSNSRNRGGNSANMSTQSTNNSATNLTTTTAAAASNSNSAGNNNNNNSNSNGSGGATAAAHMSQVNKGLLYPPPNFAHHALPLAGVTLVPQLCHPILHQNLSASLYSPNGIKQEYEEVKQEYGGAATSGVGTNLTTGQQQQQVAGNAGDRGNNSSNAQNSNNNRSNNTNNNNGAGNGDEQDISLIEPEIILQTSTHIIAAPHHFHNHAHAHHLHQQQCNMFQNLMPQAHMSHIRSHAPTALPPTPPTSHAQQQQHQQQQQQQQMQQHYAGNKGSS